MSRRMSLAVRLAVLLGIASGLSGCAAYARPGYAYGAPGYSLGAPAYRPYAYRPYYSGFYGRRYYRPYYGGLYGRRPFAGYGGFYGSPFW